jgi:N-acetylglucosamine kinase-like BadF-type ATPase
LTRYILGLDGGGTKTQAVIVDTHGRFCGAGLGGPSNYDDVGIAVAQANIGQAVGLARRQAGLADTPFAAAFLGVAGVVSETDRTVIRQIAQNLALAAPEQVGVDHDCRIALAGGLSGRPGIVQIAGTGSSCFGMNAAGESWRAGGWGHLIADEGSSYWLGVQAMRAVVCAYDGRLTQATLLTQKMCRHLGLGHMNEIMHRIYVPGLARAEVAALAPLVIQAAQAGDEVALALLRQGAQELAECILAVANQLGLAAGPCELALVGGLCQAGGIFLDPLRQAVLARLPHCRPTLAELSPVLGACLLGLQLIEPTLDPGVIQALHQATKFEV